MKFYKLVFCAKCAFSQGQLVLAHRWREFNNHCTSALQSCLKADGRDTFSHGCFNRRATRPWSTPDIVQHSTLHSNNPANRLIQTLTAPPYTQGRLCFTSKAAVCTNRLVAWWQPAFSNLGVDGVRPLVCKVKSGWGGWTHTGLATTFLELN